MLAIGTGAKKNLLRCEVHIALHKEAPTAGVAMYFDDSARVLVSEPSGTLAASYSSESGRGVLLARSKAINESRIKRTIDIVGAASLLLFFLPVMLMIAIAVRLETQGPVLFRQQRYGADRRVFMLLKFRSMTVLETEGAFRQVSSGDTRITRVGAFLRRTSLDELPQLINVLMGQMSLVGPRPHAVVMDDAYGRILPHYGDRHLVRPGITGLAQIEGFRGPTDGIEKIRMRLRCDRAYIRRWSPLYDVKILLQTPLRLLNPNAF